MLTNLPNVLKSLREVAKGQVTCKILIAGVSQDGTSTLAAALTGKEVIPSAKSYWKQVKPMKANLVTYESPSFQSPPRGDILATAGKLYQLSKDTHLLVFCIPMTYTRRRFVFSTYASILNQINVIDSSIFSNMVFALTRANEMRAEMARQNKTDFPKFFKDTLQGWKDQITEMFREAFEFDEEKAKKIPIIPVGDNGATFISLSTNADEQPEPGNVHHWLTELFLRALPVTKPNGQPTLITWNKRRVESHPNEYINIDEANKLILEAQCDMFSKMGLYNYEPFHGEAIGLILGENEQQHF